MSVEEGLEYEVVVREWDYDEGVMVEARVRVMVN